MKAFLKVLPVVFVFILFAFIGYFGTGMLVGSGYMGSLAGQTAGSTSVLLKHDDSGGKLKVPDNKVNLPMPDVQKQAAKQSVPPVIDGVVGPFYDDATATYSFTVKAEGQNLEYHLCRADGTEIKIQDNGTFSSVPYSGTGKYIVYVVDAKTSLQSQKVTVSGCNVKCRKLETSEVQDAFNSSDYQKGEKLNFKDRISRNCRYEFADMKSEEDPPISYNEIFNRVCLGIWESVSVLSLDYDETNAVSRMYIKVNY